MNADEYLLATEDLNKRFTEGMSQKDIEQVMSCFWNSPDLILVVYDGTVVHGFDDVRKAVEQMFAQCESLSLAIDEVSHISQGESVFAVGTATYEMKTKEGISQKITERWTDVRRKVDGRWVYTVDHAHALEPKVDPEQVITQIQFEDQNKAVVQRYWDGKWNERRPDILDELQTPDVIYHGTSMNMNGIEEYKQVYSSFLSAFHDTQIIVEELIADGDKVTSRVSLSGTHKGEFDGLPPTGKVFTANASTVFRLVGGKIVEEWEIFDELGLMHQLGMELRPKEETRRD
jgi:steroid delta-isomerase-like uncharacterized protein